MAKVECEGTATRCDTAGKCFVFFSPSVRDTHCVKDIDANGRQVCWQRLQAVGGEKSEPRAKGMHQEGKSQLNVFSGFVLTRDKYLHSILKSTSKKCSGIVKVLI